MDTATVFEQITKGDRVLFNDRKHPLTVTDRDDDQIRIQGPQGGEYLLHRAPDNPDVILISQHGNPDYASKVEALRVVGEWVEEETGYWQHSKADAWLRVIQNDLGYWTIESHGIDEDALDLPGFGFTERKYARETATAYIERHPEPARDA